MSGAIIESDYRDRAELKQAFFEFTPQALYGASFVEWDRLGFWNANYIPYSLVEAADAHASNASGRPRILANVSVSRMQLLLQDRPVRAIQLATVGTLPEARGRGYADRLMRHVLDREEYELAFLFGNESVANFYPKYGFRRVRERLFYRDVAGLRAQLAPASMESRTSRLLQLESESERTELQRLLAERAPITRRFGALDYEHILPFYAVYAFGDSLHYFETDRPDSAILIVAQNEAEVLNVFDVVCRSEALRPDVILSMLLQLADSQTSEICYHFTPELLDPAAQAREFDDSDSPLFVRGDFSLSNTANEEPFKFPALAQT